MIIELLKFLILIIVFIAFCAEVLGSDGLYNHLKKEFKNKGRQDY